MKILPMPIKNVLVFWLNETMERCADQKTPRGFQKFAGSQIDFGDKSFFVTGKVSYRRKVKKIGELFP